MGETTSLVENPAPLIVRLYTADIGVRQLEDVLTVRKLLVVRGIYGSRSRHIGTSQGWTLRNQLFINFVNYNLTVFLFFLFFIGSFRVIFFFSILLPPDKDLFSSEKELPP